MVLLPVADRELRVASKKPSLYWSRIGFAGIAILISGMFLFTPFQAQSALLGKQMFSILLGFTFIYCLLAGVRMTSDCISEERRNETLGLLFLTPLRGWDVVSGKMLSCSLQSVYGMFAVFPVMAISLTLGGVGFFEFCRVVLALMITLFLSLSTGVFISSINKKAVQAGMLTFLMMLIFCFGGFLGEWMFREIYEMLSGNDFPIRPDSILVTLFIINSPITTIFSALDVEYAQHAHLFWISICLNFALAWGLLWASSRLIRRVWQKADSDSPRKVSLLKRFFRRFFKRKDSSFSRPVPDGKNPIFWRQVRNPKKPRMLMICLLAIFVSFTLLNREWIDNPAKGMISIPFIWMAFHMQLLLKLWLGIEAASRFGEDRKSGALELLLCTPMRVREILFGHLRSLNWQFRLPILLMILIGLILLFRWALEIPTGPFDSTEELLFFGVMYLITFVLDLGALAWFGMWRGLNGKQVSHSASLNFLCVLTLPWLVFSIGTVVVVNSLIRVGVFISAETIFIIFFVICAANSAFWWIWGRSQLMRLFRSIPASPFREKKTFG